MQHSCFYYYYSKKIKYTVNKTKDSGVPCKLLSIRVFCVKLVRTQQGHNLEKNLEFRSFFQTSAHFFTVLLWSFSAGLFWSMNAHCLRQRETENTENITLTSTLCTQISIFSHYKEQSYSGMFTQEISGMVILEAKYTSFSHLVGLESFWLCELVNT